MSSTKQIQAISLFSGALGFDLGMEQAGFKICCCVEFNPYAVQTIKRNSLLKVIEKDIVNVSSVELLEQTNTSKPVDLIFGGPPCQPFSYAGNRKGFMDERSNTLLHFLRIVREIKPTMFVMENVKGILSSKIDDYTTVCSFLIAEFENLGYNITCSILNSADYGVPQIRERVFIFGNLLTKMDMPQPTHSSNTDLYLSKQKWKTLREAIEDLPQNEHVYLELRDRQKYFLKHLKNGQNWKSLNVSEQKNAMGKSYHSKGGKTGFYRRLDFDKPSPTLLTDPTMSATLLGHPVENRPLSIQEYRRIQMFPDHWVFCGTIREQYRQIGNAVPVGLAASIGKLVYNYI